VVACSLLVLAASACRTNTPTRGIPLLAPIALDEPTPPNDLDRAVADLAAAAFAGADPEMEEALARVRALHDEDAMDEAEAEGRPRMEGLVPLCIDLRNATLDDPVAYREASQELLDEWFTFVDPALEARLQRAVDDDPLDLAFERTKDHWESLWATTFNAVAEPIGGSIVWGLAIAPFRLATSLTHWAANMYSRPAMSVQERQALAHRKRYVERHPDAPNTPAVRDKVEEGQRALDEMQAEGFAKSAERNLAGGQYRLAELQAERAMRIASDPKDAEDAADLALLARGTRARVDALRARGEDASPETPPELAAGYPHAADAREILEALLVTTNLSEVVNSYAGADAARDERERRRLEGLADRAHLLMRADPDGPLADEAAYVLALAERDLGYEREGWGRLRHLAHDDPRGSNMQRHASALLEDPWQNTLGNFERQRRRANEKAVAFRLFGGHALRRSYPDLPLGLSYLVELPSIAQTLVMTPIRLLFGPWDPPGQDFDRAPAIAGYRYLTREPQGEHTRDVTAWLYEYETQRENWVAALALYDVQPPGDGADPIERLELTEKAASQQLAAAERAGRRDWRGSILRGVVREFPDSDAGYRAGAQIRDELENISPQRIRVTRGFLLENPDVAGPRGLALEPALLDDDLHNGELHPQGVTFLGTRVIEFALVAESGDEDDPPVKVREQITAVRLAHAVAMLDETVLLNDQIDDGDAVTPDAYRDHYLERARLGLVESPDLRAAAESDYVYESLREQYGMVRARESVLPFDLVFQGSLFDLSLGAFPRWRQPKETPDAFLYR